MCAIDTENDNVVEYYNNLDRKIGKELSGMDVIDDLESEQKERDLVKAEKDALVNAQRQELEKKVEEKLLRDQLIKQRKEEAIAARKRKKQEAADAKLAAQLSADEESRSKRRGAKSPAVGSAMSVARKQKKAEHSD